MTNLLTLCFLLGSLTVTAETLLIKQSDIKYIYDADTFFIRCQQGFRCKNNKFGVRVMGLIVRILKADAKKKNYWREKPSSLRFKKYGVPNPLS